MGLERRSGGRGSRETRGPLGSTLLRDSGQACARGRQDTEERGRENAGPCEACGLFLSELQTPQSSEP